MNYPDEIIRTNKKTRQIATFATYNQVYCTTVGIVQISICISKLIQRDLQYFIQAYASGYPCLSNNLSEHI